MASKKFSELSAVTRPALTDQFAVNQAGVSKRVTLAQLRTVFNVQDYGAVGDGVTDDWAAIQAAHDAILATGHAGVLYFPASTGDYMLSQPVNVKVTGLRILGDGRWQSTQISIIAGSGSFPLFYIRGPATDNAVYNWALGPALATGSGGSLTLTLATQAFGPYINWCESSVFLNGRTAFTAECFIKLTATSAGSIISSTGKILNGDTADLAFDLMLDGTVRAHLTTGVTTTGLAGTTTLTTGVVYHLALSWNGTTARLFVNGTQEASAAVSGTMTQKGHELGNFGHLRTMQGVGAVFDAIQGSLDSIRLSATGRYTGNFTAPTAKHAFDADTLLLENFDDDDIEFSRCMHRSSTGNQELVWLPKYTGLAPYMNYVEMGHLALRAGTGQGVWAYNGWSSHFHDLAIYAGVVALNAAKDLFNSTFERIFVDDLLGSPGGRYGLLGQSNVGERFSDITGIGYHYPFCLMGSSSGSIRTTFLHNNSDIPIVIHGDIAGSSYELIGCNTSNEDVTPGYPQRACVALSGVMAATVVGGTFEAYANAKPVFLIDGGGNATLINPIAEMHADATEIIHIQVALTEGPLRLLGGAKNGSDPAIPWSLSGITEL